MTDGEYELTHITLIYVRNDPYKRAVGNQHNALDNRNLIYYSRACVCV